MSFARLTAVGAALWLCACAAPETLLQTTDASAFQAARSYVIEVPPAPDVNDSGADLARRLRAAVEGEITRSLNAKGYRVAASDADLSVAYKIAATGRGSREAADHPRGVVRPSVGAGDPYAAYRPLAGTGVGDRTGMLLVMITSAKTGAVVWQATSEGSATSDASAERAVTRGTQAALAKLPSVHPQR